MKKLILTGIVLFYTCSNILKAQDTNPINSNYLIERGVSPRVLDAAASTLLQDGSFVQDLTIKSNKDGENREYEIQLIYDPSYTEGMDVRMIYQDDLFSEKEIKELKNLVEKSHHFSRMSAHYLYDESTLKLVKEEGNEVIFEFYYQRNDIEPYLKFIKKIKGNIIFINGELDRVVLTNTKKYKNVVKIENSIFFKRTNEGGHVVSSIIAHYEMKKGKEIYNIDIEAIVSSHLNKDRQVLSWEDSDEITPFFENKKTDTLSVKLGWFLPLMGKPATKLGYKLPRPVGLDIFSHFQNQTMKFTGISIAMNDEELVSFNELFDLDQSTIQATSFVSMLKADVWVLPFLNVMLIAGTGKNEIYGNWPIDEEVKQGLADFGWLIGLNPEDVPDAITLRGSLEAVLYGAGATLAGGVGDWNVSVSYQFLANYTKSANTTTYANVVMPMLGYMTPIGLNLMVGAQGQFYNTKVTGFIELDDSQTLHYNVDFEPIRWNAMFGIYKGFAKHWELALQAGVGSRKSVTAVFGYRF